MSMAKRPSRASKTWPNRNRQNGSILGTTGAQAGFCTFRTQWVFPFVIEILLDVGLKSHETAQQVKPHGAAVFRMELKTQDIAAPDGGGNSLAVE